MPITENSTAPTSVFDLIDRIGGRKLAAHLGGVAWSTVQSWKTRGKIPPEHFLSIIKLCDDLGIPGVNAATLVLWHASETESQHG